MTVAGAMASLVFLGSLVLIFSEKLNRILVGLCGAVVMVVLGKLFGFYAEEAALAAVDFNTLGLLMGMMILVALLEPTGFFQYLAVWAARLSRGKPVNLLILLGTVTTLVSMILDNVTTVVLIAPVTILICEILGVSPAPYLIAEAILSDTGGVATLVGDPPNIIIGSAAGLYFDDFLIYSLPVVLVVWLAALALLRYLFRHELAVQPEEMKAIAGLDPAGALHDRRNAIRVLIVLGGAVLFFLLSHAMELSASFVGLAAAAVALVWVRPDLDKTLYRVEWGVLIFFAGLFVMVGGLEAAGVLEILVHLMSGVKSIPPVLIGVTIIWVVAGLSAVVDNIPITITMVPVILGLGAEGIDIKPLWWALAFGAGFGGNGTIIGSSANIIVVALSERTRTPITSGLWNRRGLPVMLLTCAIASVLYVLVYPLYLR